MKSILVLLLVAVVAVVLGARRAEVEPSLEKQFQQYMQTYNKSYSPSEFVNHFAYFKHNVAMMKKQQALNLGTAKFAVNAFFDYSPQEVSRMHGTPYPTETLVRSCLANGVTVARPSQKEIQAAPTAWDWSQKGMVTPVKNQGQCGSCWAFSTTGVIESAYAIKTGTLVSLSEQEIVDCSHACDNEPPYGVVCNSGCDGGWPWMAMADVMSWKGMGTETQYPYKAETNTCVRTAAMISAPVQNYTCLSGVPPANTIVTEAEMMSFLYANGPLSIAMDATPLMSYTSGVLNPGPGGCSTTQLDHAILIVGYGIDSTNTPFWKVKNSWGAAWGENGYFRIIRGQGACGLNAAVTFPNM